MIWIENNTELILLNPVSGELFLAVQRGQVLPVLRKINSSTVPLPSWVVNEVDSFVVSSCSLGVRLVSFEKNHQEKNSFIVIRELFGSFNYTRIPVSFAFKFHVYLDFKCSDKIQLVDYEKNQTWEFLLASLSLKKIRDGALVRLGDLSLIWKYDSGNYLSICFDGFSRRLAGYTKYFLISICESFAVFHVLRNESSNPSSYQEELLIFDFESFKVSVVTSDLGFTVIHDASHVWTNKRYFFMFLACCEEGSFSFLLIVDICENIVSVVRIKNSSFFDFESFASFSCDRNNLFLISSSGETMEIFDEENVLVPELEENVIRFGFSPFQF